MNTNNENKSMKRYPEMGAEKRIKGSQRQIYFMEENKPNKVEKRKKDKFQQHFSNKKKKIVINNQLDKKGQTMKRKQDLLDFV